MAVISTPGELYQGTPEAELIQNIADDVTIQGNGGADTIKNFGGSNVSIAGGADNDLVQNVPYNGVVGNNVTIETAAGNDDIRNWGSSVSIAGDAGDDYLYNEGSNVTMDGGNDNDRIANRGANVLSEGGAGNDSLDNNANNVTLAAGEGDDTLLNYSGAISVSIDGGDGNDSINVYGNSEAVTVNAGANDDIVLNSSSNVTINGGDGADTLLNYSGANSVSIDGGSGIDSITNYGDNMTIDAGDDADTIESYGSNATLAGGAGDDAIYNGKVIDGTSYRGGDNVSISAGDGNDTIDNRGVNSTIDGGDGNDVIANNSAQVSINGGANNDSIYSTGESTALDAGDGADTIESYGSNATLAGGAGDDAIYNGKVIDGTSYRGGDNVSISAGDGNDTIENRGVNSTIDGGDGNDVISNHVDNVTITGGGDNDSLTNNSDNVSMDGGGGDDYIVNGIERIAKVTLSSGEVIESLVVDSGSNVTLGGGAGNDTLTGSRNKEVYVYESGNDVITNYSGEDIIKIANGSVDTYSFDGNDVVFTIGEGSLRLQNMKGRAITFETSDGLTQTIRTTTGYTGLEVIQNLVHAWNKTLLTDADKAKLDEAIRQSSHFSGIQDVIDSMIADCKTAGDADTFLRKYCGIVLDNADTGAITGWDAGNTSMQTPKEIIAEDLSTLKHVPNYYDFTFTLDNGVNIHITLPEDYDLNDDEKKVLDGLYSWWAQDGINRVEQTYGFKFKEGDTIDFTLVKSADWWGLTETDPTNPNKNTVLINMAETSFNGADDYNGNGVDRCITHEFTHVAQNFFMGHFSAFLEEGMAELTHGIDDQRMNLITSFAGNADSLASYLAPDKSGTGESEYYAAGYMFYRYFAKQAADAYSDSTEYVWKDGITINGTKKADFLTGSGDSQTITAGDGNDTITSYGKVANVAGGDGDDYIAIAGDNSSITADNGNDSVNNVGANNSIDLGDGNDSITNSGANAVITAGKGDDTIRNTGDNVWINYNAGDGEDLIYGFSENSTLAVYGTSFDTMQYGRDAIVAVDDKWLVTLKSAASLNTLNIVLNPGKPEPTIPSDTWTGTAGNDTYNNTVDGMKLYVLGGDDTIENWGDNVSIDAGAGNDEINNTGANVLFNYSAGDGNDLIQGFNETSTIQIGDGTGTYSTLDGGDDVILKIGDGQITLVGAASWLKFDSKESPANIAGQWSTFIADNKTKTPLTIAEYIEVVDATKRTKAIRIVGNALDNSILGGAGKDTLAGSSGNDYLAGGSSSDSLNGDDGDDYLDGGEGDDMLNGGTGNNTLIGGDGDDTLYGGTGNDVFVYSAGNDVIINYTEGEDKISIGGAMFDSNNVRVEGNDVTFSFGEDGALTVRNGKGKTLTVIDAAGEYTIKPEPSLVISLSSGVDTYSNLRDGATILALNGNDTVTNTKAGTNVLIDGGDDNDLLKNSGAGVTVYGGAGNDSIANYKDAANSSILGGADNDSITNSASNVTINAGAGDDTISLASTAKNNLIVYNGNDGGDGNDIIYGFNDTSTLQIGDGTGTYSTVKSGSNIVVEVGDGSVTLSKAATLSSLNIHGNIVIPSKTKYYTNNDSAADTLATTFDSGDATARTKAIKITGNSQDNTLIGGSGKDTLSGGKGNDYLEGGFGNDSLNGGSGNDTLAGGAGNDSLTGSSGTDLFVYSAGNDVITDYTAGTDKISLGAAFDTVTVDGSDAVFTFGNDALTIKNGKGKVITYIDADGAEQTIKPEAPKVIKGTSKAETLTNKVANATILAYGGNDTITNAKTGSNVSIDGGSDNDSITNSGSLVTINAGSGDDTVSLTSSAKDNVIVYSDGDGNDLIKGFNTTTTLRIGEDGLGEYSTVKSGTSVIVEVGDGKLTLSKAASLSTLNIEGTFNDGKSVTLTSGNDKYTNTLEGATVSAFGGKDTLINSGANASIDLGDGNDSITNKGANVTIYGGAGNDTLRNYSGGKNSSLNGGAGTDKIYNSATGVTMLGGTGNDIISLSSSAKNNVIAYSDGDGSDKVYGFNADDTLQIGDGTGSYSTQVSGTSVIVEVGKGKITLSKAASLSAINIAGTYVGGVKTETFDNDSTAKVTLTADTDIGDASVRTAAIRIVGNALDNSILGGSGKDTLYGKDGNDYIAGNAGNDKLYGQNGNDTLWGGAGNDTLTGGEGADTFLYNAGDGKDVITDFANDDMLQISGTFSAKYYASSDKIIFKVGSTASAITLKDFTADTFTINGDSYVISGTKLVKK